MHNEIFLLITQKMQDKCIIYLLIVRFPFDILLKLKDIIDKIIHIKTQ